MQPHGIMFHYFHDRRHPAGQGAISGDDLAGLLRSLDPRRILPARRWLERAIDNTLEPHDVCLTFDDNLRCQYDVARPVLQDYGLTAFWFVQTAALRGEYVRSDLYRQFRVKYFDDVNDFYEAFFRALATSCHAGSAEQALCRFDPSTYLAEFPFYSEADRRFRYVRDEVLGAAHYNGVMDALIGSTGISLEELADGLWMEPDHLRQLHAEGHVLGLHTHTHPARIADLHPHQQLREYRDNYTCLMSLLGEPPTAVAHPCNSYSRATLDVLRRLGIRVGFRSNAAWTKHSRLEYPRHDPANIIRDLRSGAGRSTAVVNSVTPM